MCRFGEAHWSMTDKATTFLRCVLMRTLNLFGNAGNCKQGKPGPGAWSGRSVPAQHLTSLFLHSLASRQMLKCSRQVFNCIS